MKKIIIFVFLLIGFNQITNAQKGKREKIKALKTAHITNALNLSKEEAEKFWPIYNEFQKKEHLNRKTMRSLRTKVENDLSEAESRELLNQMVDLSNQDHANKTKLVNDLLKVISAKKVIALKKAEDDFNKKLLKEFRDRRRPPPHGNGPR